MEITYHHHVTSHDIPALDKPVRLRIHHAIEQRLGEKPFMYGLPLRHNLKRLWKLRVGDWRVIYTIDSLGVFILAIGHRKEIYKLILKRL